MDFHRIASYHPIFNVCLCPGVYYVQLSAAGFKYIGGELVECVGCGKNVNIKQFVHENPQAHCFHQADCAYIDWKLLSTDTQSREDLSQLQPTSFDNDTIHTNTLEDSTISGSHNENSDIFTLDERLGNHDSLSLTEKRNFYSHYAIAVPPISNVLAISASPKHIKNIDQQVIVTSDELVTPVVKLPVFQELNSSHLSATTSADDWGLTSFPFDDSKVFNSELVLKFIDEQSTEEQLRSDCRKNPGHFAYFSLPQLTLEQLPSCLRDVTAVRFIQSFSQLVVRVVLPGEKGSSEVRIGTGYLSLTEDISEGQDLQKAKKSKVVKLVSSLVRKPKWCLFIQTSRYLVKSDRDASVVKVEFFYDDPSQSGIKTLKAVSLQPGHFIGDSVATIICQTSDSEFIQRILKVKQEVLHLAAMLPMQVKKKMVKKLLIISHPHGKRKVLSYGDSVSVKYALRITNVSNAQLIQPVKIKRDEQGAIPLSQLRRAVLYAIDTCNGSTGAPVVGFKKKVGAEGDAAFELDVWVHHGCCKDNSLGCSNLKECTEEDLFMLDSTEQNGRESPASETEREVARYSSVRAVQTSPFYHDYIKYEARLASCANWQFSHIYKPETLALAGFFFAGHSDCVRCFYCGLGLRSWKPGDDLKREHEKYKPSCPYLKRVLAETLHNQPPSEDTRHNNLPLAGEAAASEDPTQATSLFNEEEQILELENKNLAKKILCVVCHTSAVKDLFLPCGELLTCGECSKLLTHCCSCGKKILATVTTYFI